MHVWYSPECACLLQALLNFLNNLSTVSLTLCLRHTLTCSRLVHPYLFLLMHIKNPRIFRNILPQPCWGIFETLHILFRLIQPCSIGWTYILRHIHSSWFFEAYSEPLTYLASFTYLPRVIHDILNLIWTDSDVFRTLAYLGTYCFTHIQAYSQSYTYRGIFVHIGI